MSEATCPDANDISDFLSRRLDAAAFARIDSHIDGCDMCCAWVAFALRREEPTRIDRYEIERRVGAGGNGVVYAARDPKLDRKVALKLLLAPDDPEALARQRARVDREARAMAKLQHPCVVPVYDVGIFEDRLFIVMAFIEGETLRTFSADPKHGFAERLSTLASAGVALQAVHEAGLLHRDFKPDNVLVDRSGHVWLTDFGAAGSEHVYGGTPAYMSPEQKRGEALDVRADVFAFARTCEEVLGGGAARKLSVRVQRVLDAGMQADRESRTPSVRAVTDGLSRTRPPLVRWLLLMALLVLVASAVVAQRIQRGQCIALSGDVSRLAAELPDATAMLARNGVSLQTQATVGSILERFVESHRNVAQANCKTAPIGIDPKTSQCLNRSLTGALLTTRIIAQETNGQTAMAVVDVMISPESCLRTQDFEQMPADVDAAAWDEAQALLIEGSALEVAGRKRDAAATLDRAQKLSHAWPRTSLHARILERHGLALNHDDPETAEHLFEAAMLASEHAKDDETRARALLGAIFVSGHLGHHEKAKTYEATAEAVIAKLNDASELGALHAMMLGKRAQMSGRLREAETLMSRSLALVERMTPPPLEQWSSQIVQVCLMRALMGELARDDGWCETAEAITVFLHGEDHLRRIVAHHAQGEALRLRGSWVAARFWDEETLAMAVQAFGADNPILAMLHVAISEVALAAGDLEGAILQASRARSLLFTGFGLNHPETVGVDLALAKAFLSGGDVPLAEAALAEARHFQKVFGTQDDPSAQWVAVRIALKKGAPVDAIRRDSESALADFRELPRRFATEIAEIEGVLTP
jgi:eukaryotic-like serine/threonine-protein kinase